MAEKPSSSQPERLVSLDAYRGFVMLAMASSGFYLARVFSHPDVLKHYDGGGLQNTWRWLCRLIAYHSEHVAWAGGGFWDMIQPSFMFMVGVALPFSLASREAAGDSRWQQFAHMLLRSLILICLGVFLSSNGALHTNFTFVNVLTQIGLGYPIVWLLAKQRVSVQLLVSGLILLGYWYAFFQHPAPGPGLDRGRVGLPADWPLYQGLAGHWNKNTNFAAAVDVQLLNWFPQYDREGHKTPFLFNAGGYQTLNFIPSIVTMIFGLMTGNMLRGGDSPLQNTWKLLWTGGVCLLIGVALHPQLWFPVPMEWTLCPIVKRIWTPSWVFYSTAWTLWMLALFYWLIDVRGWKLWAYPFVIVGMNSIAMYIGAQLLKPWVLGTLRTHLGQNLFQGDLAAVWEAAAFLFVLWLMCLWMYRRKIFIRI